MQVTIEMPEPLVKKLIIQVPHEDINEKVNKKLKELAKTANIKGFRKGKAPEGVIRQKLGQSVRDDVLKDTIETNLYDAISKEKLNPAGRPIVNIKVFEENKPLEFEAIFEVFPEIEIAELDGIEIEQFQCTPTEEDLEKTILTIRKQHSVWEERKDGEAEIDDKVTIDAIGKIDDKPFEGGTVIDFDLVLGSKTMIAGFEDGIIGKKVGDNFDLDLVFPQNYYKTDLVGKNAKFSTTLKKIMSPVIPELDDEFAKKVGLKEGGAEVLRKNINENFEKNIKNILRTRNKEAVFNYLLNAHNFEVPKILVHEEMEKLRKQYIDYMKAHIPGVKEKDFSLEIFKDKATRRIKLGLLANKLAQKLELTIDKNELHSFIKKLLSDEGHGQNQEALEHMATEYVSNEELARHFGVLMLEDKIIDKIIEKANIKNTVVDTTVLLNTHIEE